MRPTVVLSDAGAFLYDAMIERADGAGFVGFDDCLELSVVHKLDSPEVVQELERELLIFMSTDSTGWYLRRPFREVAIRGAT